MKKTDLMIISSLRRNAREKLTNISKKTRIPVSTIFDKIKTYETGLINKHTALIDFNKLGYNTRANIILKVNKKDKSEMKNFLLKHKNINSALKINNGFDFLIEAIFTNIKEVEDFLELLEENFKIKSKQVFYIIEELKKESFLSNPELVNLEN